MPPKNPVTATELDTALDTFESGRAALLAVLKRAGYEGDDLPPRVTDARGCVWGIVDGEWWSCDEDGTWGEHDTDEDAETYSVGEIIFFVTDDNESLDVFSKSTRDDDTAEKGRDSL